MCQLTSRSLLSLRYIVPMNIVLYIIIFYQQYRRDSLQGDQTYRVEGTVVVFNLVIISDDSSHKIL